MLGDSRDLAFKPDLGVSLVGLDHIEIMVGVDCCQNIIYFL